MLNSSSLPIRWFVHGLLAAGLLALAACDLISKSPKPGDYDVRFQLDPALTGSSIQIDVIGANGVSDKSKWESYSVNDYWRPGDAMRKNAPKATLSFGRGKDQVQTLSAGNELWNAWLSSGATYLVIIADLPGGGFVDRVGDADTRRMILPLDRRDWGSETHEIKVAVQESGMRLLTPKAR